MEASKIIGRVQEVEVLKSILSSDRPELVAVYGRRRIGKTYLIERVLGDQMVFSMSGLHGGNQVDQLENFTQCLSQAYESSMALLPPTSWLQAFAMLEAFLDKKRRSKKKKVIFIDEFPWIATRRSKFLMAFENFYNSYVTKRDDIAIVICGSSASWMIEKVVKNKGGLHNRLTKRIRLTPFSLGEVELFLQAQGIKLSRYDIIQLYMVTGGVPFYLKTLQKGQSVTQMIDELCFNPLGILHNEFDELFSSLFEHEERHIHIVTLLSDVRKGLTRKDILSKSNLKSGGGFTRTIDELIESGFVTKYLPYGQQAKQALYRLTDFYSVFYMKFIHRSRSKGPGTWLKKSRGQSWKSWSGFTFESVCIEHLQQIKKALGLSVIYTEESSWVSKRSDNRDQSGTQIDLLIDRDDRIIHVCEIKYAKAPYLIDKAYAAQLRQKLETFKAETKTTKSLYLTMVTTYGIKQNEYALELVQNEVTMDALFASYS